ncbi:MAG: WecB/TagA/CpsF family glycosyltransferase [Salinivirgaceae bacterium]|jgi:N-acetylglucosaminyldiphosphoundecaprenol N-acetyl-beta-D-mannosaminyltransferase|nr:WecB/TagA/CpsF family glycosyltransferase [Salinivirgaceae bacterium]
MRSSVNLLNYDVFCGELLITHKKMLINTINPHSYCVAKKDAEFKKALQDADILLPDGIGIVLATKWLKKERIQKIAGSDIHRFLLQKANTEHLKVFYLGASESTLQLIETKLHSEYPNITVGAFSPPFKSIFSVGDTQKMLLKVNSFNPDILFVGMTAPKQEKWVHANKSALNATTICCIGAVFDFYAETVKRPPKWVINIGFEWLGRLLNEPKRMWQRNFISTPIFIFDVLVEKFRILFQKV